MVYYKPPISETSNNGFNSDAMTIGRNIRRIRISRGMAAKELAELVGVQKSTISNYENAITVPNYDTMIKIAEALHTSVDAIKNSHGKTLRATAAVYFDGSIPYFEDLLSLSNPECMPDALFPQLNGFDDTHGFLLSINNNVFEDLGVCKGAIVLFVPEAELKPDKILAMEIDDCVYLARIKSVNAEDIELSVYIKDDEIITKTIPTENNVILGIAVMSTVTL